MKTTYSYSLLAAGIFFLFGCQSSPSEAPTTAPPNIIFIIADDMAWNDCGAYGHPHIRTPNLDKLAREGMRFDRAFLTTSSCSPSRSSIITGQYPHNTDAEQLHWPLPAEQITFVEKLKAAGYWTAQAGKWHLGEAVKDRFNLLAAADNSAFLLDSAGNQAPPEADGSGCHLWVSLLKKRPPNQPFFLWLAANDPHRPYQPDIIPQPHTTEDIIVPPHLPDTKPAREDLAFYYDEISRLDDYVGKVIAEVAQQGMADQTLILFISDNGRPFPRDKTTLYDGGIKTPWIMRWPGKIKARSHSDQLVSAVDIAPTFLSIAGLPSPASFEGVDISPLFEQPDQAVREYIYAEDHWHDFDDLTRAVRSTQYKYIRNFMPELPNTPPADALRSPTFDELKRLRDAGELPPDMATIFRKPRPEEELFDVNVDPNELNNLANDPQYVAVLKTFRDELQNFQEKHGDVIPDYRTPDEFDRETGLPLPNRKRPRPSKKEMMP